MADGLFFLPLILNVSLYMYISGVKVHAATTHTRARDKAQQGRNITYNPRAPCITYRSEVSILKQYAVTAILRLCDVSINEDVVQCLCRYPR